MTAGPVAGGRAAEADDERVLAVLRARFPAVMVWRGAFTGSLWGAWRDPSGRVHLIEADDPAELARRLDASVPQWPSGALGVGGMTAELWAPSTFRAPAGPPPARTEPPARSGGALAGPPTAALRPHAEVRSHDRQSAVSHQPPRTVAAVPTDAQSSSRGLVASSRTWAGQLASSRDALSTSSESVAARPAFVQARPHVGAVSHGSTRAVAVSAAADSSPRGVVASRPPDLSRPARRRHEAHRGRGRCDGCSARCRGRTSGDRRGAERQSLVLDDGRHHNQRPRVRQLGCRRPPNAAALGTGVAWCLGLRRLS